MAGLRPIGTDSPNIETVVYKTNLEREREVRETFLFSRERGDAGVVLFAWLKGFDESFQPPGLLWQAPVEGWSRRTKLLTLCFAFPSHFCISAIYAKTEEGKESDKVYKGLLGIVLFELG